MQVQKENFMDFLSADASTDVLINNKQLKGKSRTGGRDWILEFMDDFEYINKFSKFFAKIDTPEYKVHEDALDRILKPAGTDYDKRKEIKLRIFSNFQRLKDSLSQKKRKFYGKSEKEIMDVAIKENDKDTLLLIYDKLVKNHKERWLKGDENSLKFLRNSLKQDIISPSKLYSAFVRNIPETKPSAEEFLNVTAAVDEPEEVEGWELGEKNFGGGNLPTWRKVVDKTDRDYIPAKTGPMVSKLQELYSKIGNPPVEDTRFNRQESLLNTILLPKSKASAKFSTEELEEILEIKIQRIDSLTDNQVRLFIEALDNVRGDKSKKAPNQIFSRFRVNNQKPRDYLYYSKNRNIRMIPFIKEVLSSPTGGRLFEIATKNMPTVKAQSLDAFTVDYKRKNPDAGDDLQSEYAKYLRKKSISLDSVELLRKEVEDDEDELEDLESLLLDLERVGDVYFAEDKAGIEAIDEIYQQIEVQVEFESLSQQEVGEAERKLESSRTLSFAILKTITDLPETDGKKQPLSSVLKETGPLKEYSGSSSFGDIGISEALIISHRLVQRIMQVNLTSRVEKINSIIEKEGESLSLTDPTLKQAVDGLADAINKGLNDLNNKFREEIISRLNTLIENPSETPEVFQGQVYNKLVKAGIFVKEE